MLEHVLKIQPLKEILEFQDWKRGYETYTKKKFKPEIKSIIKNKSNNFNINSIDFTKIGHHLFLHSKSAPAHTHPD